MAEEITVIGIGVDTTQVVSATDDLTRFAATGERVESAAAGIAAGVGKIDGAAGAAGRAVTGIGTATSGAAAQLSRADSAVTALAGSLSGASSRLSATAAGIGLLGSAARAAADGVGDLSDRSGAVGAGLASIVRSGDAAAQSMLRTQAATGALTRDLNALGTSLGASSFRSLAELDRLGTSLGAASTEVRAVASAINSIDTSELDRVGTALVTIKTNAAGAAAAMSSIKPPSNFSQALAAQRGGTAGGGLSAYIEQLNKAEAAQKAATRGLDRMGMSAAATAAALRNVPAQFTDIVVSLQGGQAPLTVLLQQGGQLKDMFGGVFEAMKAIGGYAVTLINPFTVLAAAGAALAAAYNIGANEAQRFREGLILTGGAAGVSAGRLSDMAEAIGRMGGVTQGKAAQVLDAIARSGSVGAGNLQRFAAAAAEFERVGGGAAENTAKAFADLAKSPLDAATRLNEGVNFLTRSLFDQIKALEEQGNKTEAARIAQEAYATAIEQRAPQMAQNLGTIERVWENIVRLSKRAIDNTLNFGREQTGGQQIAAFERQIEANAKSRERFGGIFAGSFDRSTAALTERLRLLQQGASFEALSASYQAEIAANNKRSFEFARDGDRFKSQAARREAEIAKATTEGQALVRAGLLTQIALNERIAAIREAMPDAAGRSSGGGRARSSTVDTGLIAARQQEAQQIEAIKRAEIELNALRMTGRLRETEAIERASQLELSAIDARIAAARAEAAILAGRPDSKREAAQAQVQVAQLQAQRLTAETKARAEIEIVTHRQTQAIRALNDAMRAEINTEITQALVAQSKAREQVSLSLFDYERGLRESAELLEIELAMMGRSSEERQTAIELFRIELDLRKRLAQIDDTTYDGGDAEREQVRQRARDLAAKASAQAQGRVFVDEWRKTTDRVQDLLTDALMRGFENGKGFIRNLRDTIVNIFSTMVLRPIVSAIVQPISGAVSSVIGSFLGQQQQSAGSGGGSAFQRGVDMYRGASTLNNVYGAASQYFTGASAGASGASLLYANGVRMAGGDGLGALIQANRGWAGVSTGGSSGAAGGSTMFGSIAGSAAGIAAGFYGGRAISGGFSTGGSGNSNVNTGTAIGAVVGSIIPGIGTAIGAAVGGMIGGLVNRAFGRKAPQVTGQGLEGTIGGEEGFDGRMYTDIVRKGGWFRRDKRYTDISAAPPEMNEAITTASKGILTQVKEYGKALNLPTEQLAAVTKNIRVALGTDAEANKKAIFDALGGYGEALVQSYEASLAPVKMYGETVMQTIERVAGALMGVNEVLARIGITALETSVAGGGFAVQLAEVFGGIQGLQQVASTYYDKYFTDQEKAITLQKQLTVAFAEYGQKLPESRAEFRKLVEAQDLSTESGQATFAALLGVAGAFDELQTSLESAGVTATGVSSALALRKAAIQKELDEIERVFGDFSILDETVTISDQLQSGRQRLEELQSGLGAIMGGLAKSIQETLADLVNSQRALREYRAGLSDTIADARLAAMPRADRVTTLRRTESELFGSLATASDPVEVAQRLQGVILERIQEEAALSEDLRNEQVKSIQEQIEGYKRLRDLADDLAQFTGSLRISDLSPLSFQDRLASAESQFASTLASAQSGDPSAQGNLTTNAKAYLDEARAYFGSSAAYADIFERVTGSLDAFGGAAPSDVQMAALEAQLNALDNLNIAQAQAAASSQAIVVGLTALDTALAAREEALSIQVETQKDLALQQIEEQRAINVSLTAQLTQAQAGFEALKEELERLNDSVDQLVTNDKLAVAEPT